MSDTWTLREIREEKERVRDSFNKFLDMIAHLIKIYIYQVKTALRSPASIGQVSPNGKQLCEETLCMVSLCALIAQSVSRSDRAILGLDVQSCCWWLNVEDRVPP